MDIKLDVGSGLGRDDQRGAIDRQMLPRIYPLRSCVDRVRWLKPACVPVNSEDGRIERPIQRRLLATQVPHRQKPGKGTAGGTESKRKKKVIKKKKGKKKERKTRTEEKTERERERETD
jgi:hypothetical protein